MAQRAKEIIQPEEFFAMGIRSVTKFAKGQPGARQEPCGDDRAHVLSVMPGTASKCSVLEGQEWRQGWGWKRKVTGGGIGA